MDYNDDAPKKGFTIGKLFKWLFAIIALSIFLLLVFRSCALEGMRDTAKTRKLLWNDVSLAAYKASPDNFSVARNTDESIMTPDGTITISGIRWIRNIGQLQLTIRYNNSLARTIRDTFSLDAEPQGEFLTFALRDDIGNLYTTFEYITDSAFIYNYRRLVFDGINLDGCAELKLEIYYTGYVDYDSTAAPLNTVLIYQSSQEFKDYTIKSDELPGGGVTPNLEKSRKWVKKEISESN